MSQNVLLVDDNLAVQKLVELTLRKEGFEITSVDNGLSALDIALKEPPDLILADYNLEGINIFSFVQKIKQKERLAETPIVLLVNTTENYDPAQFQSVGIQAFLKKPIDARALIEETKKQTGTAETVVMDLKALAKKEELSLSEHFSNPENDAVKIEELLGWSSPGTLQPDLIQQTRMDQTIAQPVPTPMPTKNLSDEEEMEKTQYLDRPPRMEDPPAEADPPAPVETAPLLSQNGTGGADHPLETPEGDLSPALEEAREPEPISAPPALETVDLHGAADGNGALNKTEPIEAGPALNGESVGASSGSPPEIREAVEKAVRELLPGLIESVVRKEMVLEQIEKIVWEVVPALAEIEIKKEIKRLQPEN